jgi:glyoxylase-like metal-dependent hydrolase (beta-lactamase superfamily II)
MTDFEPGKAVELAPGVRRLVAPNPGLMTGPGTNTYLLGEREVAVIDPGPRIEVHLDAIREEAPGRIRWILVTHTHPDHSPAAMPLAQQTDSTLLGMPPPKGKVQDKTFRPDRVVADGELLETDEFTLRAVHTPGHASNHVCYRHEGEQMLFTGDHIMNGSTVVIDPPDGNMSDYLASLDKLKTLGLASLAPGHGGVIDNPNEMIDWLVDHRLGREAKVVASLDAHPDSTLWDLTAHVYDEVDPRLHRLASRSLLAHLEKLELESRAERTGDRWRLTSQS